MKALLFPVAVALALATAACSGDSPPAGGSAATATPTGGAPAAVADGRDACLKGTWNVDMDELAKAVAAMPGPAGKKGTATGKVTLTFGETMKMDYTNAAVTVETPGSTAVPITIRSTFNGTAESKDYKAADGKISGTMTTNTVQSKMAMVNNGTEVDLPSGGVKFDLDPSSVPINYTCTGSKLTLNNGFLTWHLNKA